MSQAIGFATKFYTLWSIDKEGVYYTDSNGKSWLVGYNMKYFYHKNISTDLVKAKSLYPDLNVIEELRGKTQSWTSENKEDLCPHIMKFGKYEGYDINELITKDFDYVLWICENRSGTNNGMYANELQIVKDYYQAIEDANKKAFDDRNKIFDTILSAGTYEFVAEHNLKLHEGFASIYLKVDEGYNMYVEFIFQLGAYTKNFYNGYTYGLPVVKGKAKRMKGKTITLTFIKDENAEDYDRKVIVTNIAIK